MKTAEEILEEVKDRIAKYDLAIDLVLERLPSSMLQVARAVLWDLQNFITGEADDEQEG